MAEFSQITAEIDLGNKESRRRPDSFLAGPPVANIPELRRAAKWERDKGLSKSSQPRHTDLPTAGGRLEQHTGRSAWLFMAAQFRVTPSSKEAAVFPGLASHVLPEAAAAF